MNGNITAGLFGAAGILSGIALIGVQAEPSLSGLALAGFGMLGWWAFRRMWSELDRLSTSVADARSRVDILTTRVDAMAGGMEAISGRMDALEARMEAAEMGQERITSRLEALNGRVALLERRDVG